MDRIRNYYSRKEITDIFSESVNLPDIYSSDCFWHIYCRIKRTGRVQSFNRNIYMKKLGISTNSVKKWLR